MPLATVIYVAAKFHLRLTYRLWPVYACKKRNHQASRYDPWSSLQKPHICLASTSHATSLQALRHERVEYRCFNPVRGFQIRWMVLIEPPDYNEPLVLFFLTTVLLNVYIWQDRDQLILPSLLARAICPILLYLWHQSMMSWYLKEQFSINFTFHKEARLNSKIVCRYTQAGFVLNSHSFSPVI